MDTTILIIGAGTFGVSTAWHLSQNHSDPSKITIIDRQASPPSLSAAADINRILTADYHSPLYANLAKEALKFWAEDPDLEWYFHKVGRLVLVDENHSDDSRRRVETQAVKLSDLKRRWGVLDGTDTQKFQSAYLDPEAGWVDSATATWQFLETVMRRRVKREVADVTELLFERITRRVRGARAADGRIFLAETVILAAGAWTSALLSPLEDALDIADEDRMERQAQATAVVSASFPVADEMLKTMTACKMPCIMYGKGGEVIPAYRENEMLRYTNLDMVIINSVTTRSGSRISVPPARKSQHHVPHVLKVDMRGRLTQRLLPSFTKSEPRWRMCCTLSTPRASYLEASLIEARVLEGSARLVQPDADKTVGDNLTPTEDLLLCEHPQIKSLFIITGGSFNGYKFMPNIGKYMINVLKRQGNGSVMDRAWGWKSKDELEAASCGLTKRRELKDLENDGMSKL